MKVVADEGVDRPIVARLRQDGHEVAYIAEIDSGLMERITQTALKDIQSGKSIDPEILP